MVDHCPFCQRPKANANPARSKTVRAFLPPDDSRSGGAAWGRDWPQLPVMGKDLYAGETKAKKRLIIASGGRREDPEGARREFWKNYEPFNAIVKIPKPSTERKKHA